MCMETGLWDRIEVLYIGVVFELIYCSTNKEGETFDFTLLVCAIIS